MIDIRTRDFIETRDNTINSYVIVYRTPVEKEIQYKPVEFSNNILEKLNKLKAEGNTILAVYNYALDLKAQFEEAYPKHITPFPRVDATEEDVIKALDFASKIHEGQPRKSGGPYIEHPKRVAENVKTYCKKEEYVNFLRECALLHDVIEDTKEPQADIIAAIVSRFGLRVACIVHELTNDPRKKYDIGKTAYLEAKMINMSSMALFVKLCDRLDNVRDLEGVSKGFKEKTVESTIEILWHVTRNRILNEDHLIVVKEILDELNKNINNSNQEEKTNAMLNSLVGRENKDRNTLLREIKH